MRQAAYGNHNFHLKLMKKIFISLLAVLLCAGSLQAQELKSVKFDAKANLELGNTFSEKHPGVKNVMPCTIELGEKERIMAYIDTEDMSAEGLGLNANLTCKAGVLMQSNIIDPYKGNKITRVRFGLASNVTNAAVFVYPVSEQGEIGSALCEQTVGNAMKGWNDIKLDEPVTIPEDVAGLLIGYQYKQNYNARPLALNENGKGLEVSYMYYKGSQGENWYDVGISSYGILCVQAIVEMENLPESEVVLSDVALEKSWYKTGSTFNLTGKLKNFGAVNPASYTLEMTCNGKVIGTADTPIKLTGAPQDFTVSGTIPEDLALKAQDIFIKVKDIDGTPAANSYETKASFNAYANDVARQMYLVEQFTAQLCSNCPMGEALLQKLTTAHTDVAWVALHCKGMGKDFFHINDCDYIENAFAVEGYPSAGFNRVQNADGVISTVIGFPEGQQATMAESFYKMMALRSAPAMVTLKVSTQLDGNKLTVKVDGDAPDEAFKNYYGEDKDPVVVVYLTEDKLKASQMSSSGIIDFEHNNVLRATVGNTAGINAYGTPLAWNGNGFSNEFSTTLDETWNKDNMNVVVFVTRNSNVWTNFSKADVNNCVKVKLGESTTAIGQATTDTDVYETARYTMDGRHITAPAKGLNIVKMSNGTTKKVLVQ